MQNLFLTKSGVWFYKHCYKKKGDFDNKVFKHTSFLFSCA